MHVRRSAIGCAVVAAVAGSALTAGAASAATKNLNVLGEVEFNVNEDVRDTSRFSPSVLTIKSGDTVRIRDRSKTGEPHTFSIVPRRQLPDSFEELEQAPFLPLFMAAHGVSEENEEAPPTVFEVQNFAAPAAGAEIVYDGAGDSVFWSDNKGPRLHVTAAKGKTLSYLCLIHAWMQGSIRVR